ncbi:MAG: PAS domain S-box protein [Candidatus Hermodarchaeota archaeon]
MLDESILNLQISLLLIIGTFIFIFVCLKRKDLIIYLPAYTFAPIGYIFIYLEFLNNIYRLLGNAIFLIAILALLIAIFYEYYKIIYKNRSLNRNSLLPSMVPLLIISIQATFSLLLLISIIMIIKLYSIEKSPKYVSLIIFLSSAFLSSFTTILSNFNFPGLWELSFMGMFIFCTCYFVFPILIYLEERLIRVGKKLTTSEERYRLISENANDLIAMLNAKYEYEYINEHAYHAILGYTKKDLIGKNALEIIHPEDTKRLMNSSDLLALNLEELNDIDKEELRARHKDGHYVWLEYTSKFLVDDQGTIKVIVISRDITEHKKADLELKESEEKFRTLFEKANDGILLTNYETQQIFTGNKKICEMLGYSIEELQNMYFEDLHPKNSLNHIENQFEYNLREESSIARDIPMKKKDGSIFYCNVNNFKIELGEKRYFIGLFRDITERRKAEIELKESEEKFRVITEQSFIGAIIEQDFDLKYINTQFAKILGLNSEDLLNWKIPDFFDIIHPDDINSFKELIDKKTNNLIQDIKNFQFRIIKKNGEIVWLELFSKAIMYQDKPGNLALVMDITELKKIEEIVREENKKLVELDELRKELITRISHELRTPLTTIYGTSQILLDSNKKEIIEKIWPYLEMNYRGSVRLKELVDNLLDASRLDNRKLEIKVTKVNLTSMIQDCIKELLYQANNRQLTIIDDFPPEYYFTLDKHRFSQVIINILSNAIKNTTPFGKIFLRLNETINYVDIIIQDTGVGITKEEKKNLFQKFGKIERYGMNLDVDIEGAGLGLYISKEIVELHGGQILVESDGRNKGSTFIIRLYK